MWLSQIKYGSLAAVKKCELAAQMARSHHSASFDTLPEDFARMCATPDAESDRAMIADDAESDRQ